MLKNLCLALVVCGFSSLTMAGAGDETTVIEAKPKFPAELQAELEACFLVEGLNGCLAEKAPSSEGIVNFCLNFFSEASGVINCIGAQTNSANTAAAFDDSGSGSSSSCSWGLVQVDPVDVPGRTPCGGAGQSACMMQKKTCSF